MQQLQLSIPEPCNENWQNMTPTEQGRFCRACAKEVVDFSMMTDTEVLNYFNNLTHEKICGNVLPSQLQRTINQPKEPKKKLFWYWNYIVMFFMFFKGNNAVAQTSSKPATELSPANEIRLRGQTIAMPENGSRVITGKVTDIDGNPVSFASIKMKGTNTGVSADANGAYSLSVKPNAILIISGAGFKELEIPVGNLRIINTVMEKMSFNLTGDIVITAMLGGISFNNYNARTEDKVKNVAIIKVKDEQTDKAIPGVSVVIHKGPSTDTVIADNKGMHKIKGIEAWEEYDIEVMATGYEPNEFTINASDFKDRKKEWNVLLKKQKPEFVKAMVPVTVTNKARLYGNISTLKISTKPLYVVDGTIMADEINISPEDIEDMTVLKATEASAIFGIDGANGAVVITTRQSKIKNLDTVAVTTDFGVNRIAGGISFTQKVSYLDDTIATVKTFIADSIKVYPNPVQRNSSFSVALKFKQGGAYNMQVTDITGSIVLQRRLNAQNKQHTEQIQGDARWAAGVYYVRVFDAKNKLVSKSSFIVQ